MRNTCIPVFQALMHVLVPPPSHLVATLSISSAVLKDKVSNCFARQVQKILILVIFIPYCVKSTEKNL